MWRKLVISYPPLAVSVFDVLGVTALSVARLNDWIGTWTLCIAAVVGGVLSAIIEIRINQ